MQLKKYYLFQEFFLAEKNRMDIIFKLIVLLSLIEKVILKLVTIKKLAPKKKNEIHITKN